MGILDDIKKDGTVVTYDKFSLSNLTEMFKSMRSQKAREPVMLVGGYGMAVMQNDKERIAFYEKQFRVDKFRRLKELIIIFGIEKAKVIEWLNKKGRKEMFYGNRWRLTSPVYNQWRYKDIHNGELDTIMLIVGMEDNKFSIRLLADDSDGYGGYEYDKVLSQNISFKSIINQINYFTKKLENGTFYGS